MGSRQTHLKPTPIPTKTRTCKRGYRFPRERAQVAGLTCSIQCAWVTLKDHRMFDMAMLLVVVNPLAYTLARYPKCINNLFHLPSVLEELQSPLFHIRTDVPEDHSEFRQV